MMSSAGLPGVHRSSVAMTLVRGSSPQLRTTPLKWICPPGLVASLQNFVTSMHGCPAVARHRQRGSFTYGAKVGEPPQAAPSGVVVGVVAVSPLCGNAVLVVVTVPVLQFLKVMTPRLVAGGLSLIGRIVSCPVGRTSPTPFCQLRFPANERTSTLPPMPNVGTKSPRA